MGRRPPRLDASQAAAADAQRRTLVEEFRAGSGAGSDMKSWRARHPFHCVASPEEAEQPRDARADLIRCRRGRARDGQGHRQGRRTRYRCLPQAGKSAVRGSCSAEASLLEPQAARRMGAQVVQVPGGQRCHRNGARRSRRPASEPGARARQPTKTTTLSLGASADGGSRHATTLHGRRWRFAHRSEDGWRVIRRCQRNELGRV